MLEQYFYALMATAVTHAVLSSVVYFKGRNHLTNCTYAAYSMAISVWSAGEALAITAIDPTKALWLWRFNHIGVIFIPIFFVHFVTSLLPPHEKLSRKPRILISYITGLFFLATNLGGVLIQEVVPKFHFNNFINSTPIYPVFFFLWVGWAVYGLVELFHLYFRVSPVKRNQLSYFSLSMLVAYVGGAPNFLPTFNIEVPFLMPFGTYAIPIYGLFTAYAIARYRLLDIRLAFTRTTIFFLLYGIIAGVPLALLFPGRVWLEELLGDRWWTFPIALYAVLSTAGPFLYLTLQRKAEEKLMAEQRRYQQTLLQASRGMTLIKDLDHLLRLIVRMLTRTVRITHTSVYLRNDETHVYERRVERDVKSESERLEFPEGSPLPSFLIKERAPLVAEELKFQEDQPLSVSQTKIYSDLDRLKASVVVPSFIQKELIGFLVLGEKRSGQIYTQDDLDTLSTLANQAALAFENCEFIKKVEQTQMQLFQAAKMADLGTMASGIGHQINNRLGVIKLGAECVCMTDLKKIDQAARDGNPEVILENTAKIRESLGRVSASATKGSEIVRALLDFSRLSEGFKAVSFSDALEHALRLWECKKELRAIKFENRVPAELPLLWANFSHLEEILINLLDNAYDAVKMKEEAWELGKLPKPENPEKGTVVISAAPAAPAAKNSKSYLQVEVSDTGIGMDEETRKQMFVPFFTTKSTAIKGTGLGLFVIKQMVDAHKGEISIESRYGEGAVFHLLLPLAPQDAAKP